MALGYVVAVIMPRNTKLGPMADRRPRLISDQYSPRVTLKIGPVEGSMIRNIAQTERDVSPSWVVLVGLPQVTRWLGHYRPSYHTLRSEWPQAISVRLPISAQRDVDALATHPEVIRWTGPQGSTNATVLRLAIWSAWYTLGCPVDGARIRIVRPKPVDAGQFGSELEAAFGLAPAVETCETSGG